VNNADLLLLLFDKDLHINLYHFNSWEQLFFSGIDIGGSDHCMTTTLEEKLD